MDGTAVIPFSRPTISESDIDSVVKALRSGWLASGPMVREFERQFAEKVGAPFAVATSSCTAALFCALRAAGVGPDDAVIVPNITFTATAEAVLLTGATVVFADVPPGGLMVTRATVEAAADAFIAATGRSIKAAIVMHYAGDIADTCDIHALCIERSMHIVNDCAHCLESFYRSAGSSRWKRVGELPGICCYSFYPNKCITTGLGGMVTTANWEVAEWCRSFVAHGITKDPRRLHWDYEVSAEGFNFNMSEMAGALGVSQLARSAELYEQRARIAQRYDAALAAHPHLVPVTGRLPDSQTSHHLYVVALRHPSMTRDQLLREMAGRGIVASVHWRPLHQHSAYRELIASGRAFHAGLPNSEAMGKAILSLPCFPSLTDAEQDQILDVLKDV